MTRLLPHPANGRFRTRIGLTSTVIGFFIFLLGAEPGLFAMDRSPVIGIVQIAVFLVGMGVICLGGYVLMNALWNGIPKTIAADIGLRLVSTGYVIAVVSGMADVFGFGSQLSPQIPYFGHWQMRGVIAGEAVIALGFILLIPFSIKETRPPDQSSTDTHQEERDAETRINLTID